MGFQRRFLASQSAEWGEFYVDLRRLSAMAGETKRFRYKASLSGAGGLLSNFSDEERRFLALLRLEFEDFLAKEIAKVEKIHRFFYARVEKRKLLQLAMNLTRANHPPSGLRETHHRNLLSKSVKMAYEDLTWLKEFATANLQAAFHCLKLYRKAFSRVWLFSPEKEAEFELLLRRGFTFRKLARPQRALHLLETIYAKQGDQREKVRDISGQKSSFSAFTSLSTHQLISLGLLIGLALSAACLLLFALLQNEFFDRKSSNSYARFAFPMFRGPLLLALFSGSWAADLLVFRDHRLDFEGLFSFKMTPNSSFAQLFLSMVKVLFIILCFCYCVFSGDFESGTPLSHFFNRLAGLYLMPAAWVSVLVFDGLYYRFSTVSGLLKLIGKYLASPFVGGGLSVGWVGTLTLSYGVILKDFGYLWCYFGSTFADYSHRNSCLETTTFVAFQYVYLILPVAFRALAHLANLKSRGRRFEILRVFALLLVVASTILGNFVRNDLVLALWAVATPLSAILHAYLDIRDDWKLFDSKSKHFLLRDTLIFKRQWLYYLLIVANFPLRLAWVITLQPVHLYSDQLTWILVELFAGVLEAVRRGVWNALLVEALHIEFKRKYKILNELDLPVKVPFARHRNFLKEIEMANLEDILAEELAQANLEWSDGLQNPEPEPTETEPSFSPDEQLRKDIESLQSIRRDYEEYLKESVESLGHLKDQYLENNCILLDQGKKKFISQMQWASEGAACRLNPNAEGLERKRIDLDSSDEEVDKSFDNELF